MIVFPPASQGAGRQEAGGRGDVRIEITGRAAQDDGACDIASHRPAGFSEPLPAPAKAASAAFSRAST